MDSWALSWAAMFVAYFFMPVTPVVEHPEIPCNIDYGYGLKDPSQTKMPQHAWFGIMHVAVPFVLALPAHPLLKRLLDRPSDQ